MMRASTEFNESLCIRNRSIKIETQGDDSRKDLRRGTKMLTSVFSKSLNMRLKSLYVKNNTTTTWRNGSYTSCCAS